MDEKRPVNLNLLSMRFPVTAIASIGHRLTGVLLFLLLPLMLWVLASVLADASSYAALQHCLAHPVMCCVDWVLMVCVGYHVLAGIRHLLMDAHVLSHSFCLAKATAWLLMLLTLILGCFYRSLVMVSCVSKRGVRDWLAQRVTAIIVLIYSVFIVARIFCPHVNTQLAWQALFSHAWMKVATLLAVASVLWHAWIGLWTVLTDYVKPKGWLCFFQILVLLYLVAMGLWALLLMLT